MNLRYLSINQLSEVTGKDRRTIKKRLAGIAPHSEDGRAQYFDAHVVIDLLFALDSSQGIDKKLQQEELRIESARREKLEIEVKRLRGEMLPIDVVAKELEMACTYVRAQLFSLPNKLSMPLAIISDPAVVNEKIHNALSECLTELNTDHVYIKRLAEIESAAEAKLSDIQPHSSNAAEA